MHVVVPSANEDSIVRLKDEVVTNIIDYDCLVDLSAQKTEILHEEWSILRCVLPVKSVFDVVFHIDLINHLVSILLQRCRENNYLVVLSHGFNELDTSRPH